MLGTEGRDPHTAGIDLLPEEALVVLLIDRHADVAAAVRAAAGPLATAVAVATERMCAGGRLVYAGAGTSGRLAEADAAELAPTYGWPPERVAVLTPRADSSEDSGEHGAALAREAGVAGRDVLVAIAASGRTRFTLAALEAAREAGAATVAIVGNPGTPLANAADVAVAITTGAEPIAGSTRMRAGLAQKLALTVFSTAVMVRLGRTYDNLMVQVEPSLAKLRERRVRIVAAACGLPDEAAAELVAGAGEEVPVAIVMGLTGAAAADARAALREAGGVVRAALAVLRG